MNRLSLPARYATVAAAVAVAAFGAVSLGAQAAPAKSIG